jgi:succinoglycan biosynthesis protein ExoA
MNEQPRVDVIMSTYNEERDIAEALEAVLAQSVPVAVTVIDGGSTDSTPSILRAWTKRDGRVRAVTDGVRRTLPQALNLALSQTDLPIVAKVDARTFVAPDFLECALAVIDEPGNSDVACTGGQPEQFGTTSFGEGVARARTSSYGVGASGYADKRPRADVDTVQCGVYRRDAVVAVGNFDPVLQYGEDEELNWRLRRAGWRIVRDAAVRFSYATRPSWPSAFRQYRNYGRARVAVAAKHPGFLRPHHLAPSAVLLAGAALLAAAPFSKRARVVLCAGAALYGLGAAVSAARACGRDAGDTVATMAAFTALHAGYGLGLSEAAGMHLLQRARAAFV